MWDMLKKHIPLFTYVFFFLKNKKWVLLFFNVGPFPLPSTRLRRTVEGEQLHWNTGGHALLSLSSSQGWDVCKQENNFDLCGSGKMSLSLQLEMQLFIKSKFLWVKVIFHFFIRTQKWNAFESCQPYRNVSGEFVVCQFSTKLRPLELLQHYTRDFSTT